MNNSKIKLFPILLTVAFSSLCLAGGSVYSRYGFGDIQHYGDNRTYGMSGTGIALLDDGFINILNPAGLARISYTRFSAGFEYNNFLSKDETGSSFYSTGGIQGLAFAFPISKADGIVMSAEFTPYSKVSYGITSSLFDSVSLAQENKTFFGNGGISYLGLGLSASPLTTLHVGARLNFMFGRIQQYQTAVFNIPNYAPTSFDRSIYYSGFTVTLGTIYEGLDHLLDLPSLQNLSLGLTLRTASSLEANVKRIYSASDTTNENGTADIPFSLGFGLSYLLQNRYRFLGDVVTENWGSTSYFGSHPVELRNSFRASCGFEALPAKNAESFWNRIVYRAGLAYNSTYYQVNGVGINEYLVSGGLGLPMGPESQLNIGLQVGVRGSIDNHLQKDTIIRLSVGISASEVWFLRFDEE